MSCQPSAATCCCFAVWYLVRVALLIGPVTAYLTIVHTVIALLSVGVRCMLCGACALSAMCM